MSVYNYQEKKYPIQDGKVFIPFRDVGYGFRLVIFIIIDKENGEHYILSQKNAKATLADNGSYFILKYDGMQAGDTIRLNALIDENDIVRAIIDGEETHLFPKQVEFLIE